MPGVTCRAVQAVDATAAGRNRATGRPQHEAAAFARERRQAIRNLRPATHRTVGHAADGDFDGEAGEYNCGQFEVSTLRPGGEHATIGASRLRDLGYGIDVGSFSAAIRAKPSAKLTSAS